METKPEYEFVSQLAREVSMLSPYAVAMAAGDLMRLARRHQSLAVAMCNGYPDERGAELAERETERIRKRITEITTSLGLSARFGGDPRGYTVKIAFPSGAYNTWGGREEGWGVPT